MNRHALVALLALGATSTAIHAASLPEAEMAPLPFVRPDNPADPFSAAVPSPSPDQPAFTGSVPSAPIRSNRLQAAPELKAGLDAMTSGEVGKAIAVREGLLPGSLDRQILTWAIVTSGAPLSRGEIAAAVNELEGWPRLKSLRGATERALYRENPEHAEVLGYFGSSKPETVEGAIVLVRALIADGKAADASKLLRHIWQSELLTKPMEDRIIAEFAQSLSASDHRARMAFLMHKGAIAQAKRFADLGQAQALHKAWAAVINNSKDAAPLLAGLDGSQAGEPAALFARIELLRRQDKYEEAADLLQKAPRNASELIDTTEWWNERRIVARGLADRGDFKRAYDLVASYTATAPADIVDAEFHAGWYALRPLKDPLTAEKHFRKILEVSNRPLSASRALYWLGRTAEDGGPGDAKELFAKAARYPETFYGQLAADRLGIKTLNVTYPEPTPADRESLENRAAIRAIARLEATGYGTRANVLYRALAEELTSPGELSILSARAEGQANHALALQIGKTALGRGLDVAALAYPLGVIPAAADIGGSGKALAYAIARQESAFNPAAISPANARGLLQLLPATAQGVAKRHGLGFTAASLTSDAGYNATLGAHYLGEQIDTFGGSYILTFIAYNAGPKRVGEWISRYGDPRGKPIDEVVDWIERIPFPETRNYVQRVMENYQVYKARLGQEADISADLRFGRR